MARISVFLLFLSLAIVFSTCMANQAVHRRSRARAFVASQCRMTKYPKLCFNSLSGHVNATMQSPRQLAQIALTVSLYRARYTEAYVIGVAKQLSKTKGRGYQAVKDCLNQISDGVDQIAQSIKELGEMDRDGESAFFWHESNVKSWVTAASSEANTCLDGFLGNVVGGKTRAMIKARVLNVVELTSNALALFNRFAARHRAARATKKP